MWTHVECGEWCDVVMLCGGCPSLSLPVSQDSSLYLCVSRAGWAVVSGSAGMSQHYRLHFTVRRNTTDTE